MIMGSNFRYKRLGYVALTVTDIEASTRFLTDIFGLDYVEQADDGTRFFRVGSGHHDLMLTPARQASCLRWAWELESPQELEAAFAHYRTLGLDPFWLEATDCQLLSIARAFRVVDPVIGATWEYFIEMTNYCSPLRNRLTSFQGGKHFGICVPDNRAMTDFLCDAAGFLMSDYVGGKQISLVRAWPNPNHHSIGTVETPGKPTRLHHIAFMVNEIDDIGRLFNRCQHSAVDIHFGMGRHPTSGSIHLYIYGPDNFVWEYTLGMEQFPETGARQPRSMSANPEHYDLWGAMPDDSRSDLLPVVAVSPVGVGATQD
jgi:2,3-dihydroxy-p-cumate/2,3-dihydroxybenzoate 3,4-dioxygenase